MKINFSVIAKYPTLIRVGLFLLTLLLLWLPLAAPIYFWGSDANLVTILTMGWLFAAFLVLVRFWGKLVYQQTNLLKSYGLSASRKNALELLKGLDIGLLLALTLFFVAGKLGWLVWQSSDRLPIVILEGLISALGVGFAEELVFRGWLLDELERDYSLKISLWVSSLVFALLHFIKPLSEIIRTFPQFPALLLLGLTFVWAKRGSRGRLGLPIGLHAGLVWGYYIINVGQLVRYSDRVPPWITGIDGNPLAGLMGFIFLGAIASAFWLRQKAGEQRR
ncbi:abortive phage infection protein [[Phormidium ambiguum] IAM M-71]|uniref:Abortive phage infection protein n=1 Tax=[Phormidium ambiguum] IAM M-71 TaxID=454136 RepID=A0A1U7IH69_9CYAN|nr:abortive phage infection protein [Phormidium ambiguum IAM M-71]